MFRELPVDWMASSWQRRTRMPMLRLTRHQRLMVAEKLLDGANVAVGALVFGQFVAGRDFSIGLAAFGVGIWLSGFASALAISKEAP